MSHVVSTGRAVAHAISAGRAGTHAAARRVASRAARLPLALAAAALLAAPAAAGESAAPFVYALTANGRMNLKVTPLEDLPTGGAFRFTDVATESGDRWALRVDGRVFRNGSVELVLPFAPVAAATTTIAQGSVEGVGFVPVVEELDAALDRAAWIRLRVGGGVVLALSAGGRVTRDATTIVMLPTVDPAPAPDLEPFTPVFTPGIVLPEPPPESLFADLIDTPSGTFALRLDGALFDVERATRVGDFDAGPGFAEADDGAGAADGAADHTLWVRLAYDAVHGELLALRADGRIVAVPAAAIPLGPAPDGSVPRLGVDLGALVAALPATPATIVQRGNLYVDLETSGDDWYALRRDGATFTRDATVIPMLPPVGPAFFGGNPYTTPFDGPDRTGNPFVDLALFDGQAWRLRSLGQLYADAAFLDALLGIDFVGLAIGTVPPDLSGIPNHRPVVASYRTRIVEGEDVVVPILAVDVDRPADELLVDVDLSGIPGATFDAATRRVIVPRDLPPGRACFEVLVDDGMAGKPVRQRLCVRVLPASGKTTNTPPVPSKIGKVMALVGVELVLPITVTDRDGDAVVVEPADSPDALDVFERGATFDPGTRTLRWTPECLDAGRRRATFTVSDGQATRKLGVCIDVLFPLFWEDEP